MKKDMQEPKRHHYIPRFILRNFNDENSQIYYWDLNTKQLEKRNTRSVFMGMNMYRDEKNFPEQPTLIEKTLAEFESEISELINGKLLSTTEVVLTRTELEKLRIFLSLLSFRSNSRMIQYQNAKFDESTRQYLKSFSDEEFESLWKKELLELAKCRTYKEIVESKEIDEIIKLEFLNDIEGMYMTLVDARGGDFIITDVYPTLEIFPLMDNVNIHMHSFFPISSTRMLVLNHIMFKQKMDSELMETMKAHSHIKGDILTLPVNKRISPWLLLPEDKYIYRVKRIYEEDVQYITALQLNEAKVGIAFKRKDRILKSVVAFNRREDTKQRHEEFEKILKQVDK